MEVKKFFFSFVKISDMLIRQSGSYENQRESASG